MKQSFKTLFLVTVLSSSFLTACHHDDSDNIAMQQYEVRVTNMTQGQPLSPVATIIHDTSYSAFNVGVAASTGLEMMAEGGDNSGVLQEAVAGNVITTVAGTELVLPGATITQMFSVAASDVERSNISVLGMFVNTNDSIVAVNTESLASLAVNASMTVDAAVYDAGTEANTESAATIPGPAGGGEGFNATRDDIANQVSMHPGVVTAAGGLTGSVLTSVHQWTDPAVQVTVTRVQ